MWGRATLNHGCGFTVAVRCHPLRLVLHCWQQQSAGVITAQSAQAPAECHCQGPAIRYGTPNGYLGRMATINYHYSSLSSHLPVLFIFCILSHSFISRVSFIRSPSPRFSLWLFTDSAEQQWVHRSPKEKKKWKLKHSDGKPLSLCVSQEVLPCSQYVITGL